jgi:uncharacterized delta-60 repeat protein
MRQLWFTITLLLLGTVILTAQKQPHHKFPWDSSIEIQQMEDNNKSGKTTKSHADMTTTTAFFDTTFGTNKGYTRHPINCAQPSYDEACAMALQADGKIVTAGSSRDTSNHYAFALARYDTNGILDKTFGTYGTVRTYITDGIENDDAYSVAIQKDGKIVAAGTRSIAMEKCEFAIARFHPDGTLDTTFGTHGTVHHQILTGPAGDVIYSITIQSDGKIVAAGASQDKHNNNAFVLARYNPNGTLDSTFGACGIVRHTITGSEKDDDMAFSVALQTDNKIVAAGYSSYDGVSSFALTRYNTNGTLDHTFGKSGIVSTKISANEVNDAAQAVAIQDDGKIVAGGNAGSDLALARYNTDGTLDGAFGTGGTVQNTIAGGSGHSIAFQRDGKIILVGGCDVEVGRGILLTRYSTRGIVDTTFGDNGIIRYVIGESYSNNAHGLAVQADGKIITAGTSNNHPNYHKNFTVARFLNK